MKTAHPSEPEIQFVALEPSRTGLLLQQHIEQCQPCQARVANYRIVVKAIIEQEVPEFDFDLSALVLEQVAVQKTQTRWFAACFYVLIVLVVSALVLVGYVNWATIAFLFTGVSPTIVGCLCISALSILFFQFWENYQKHRERMQALDGFY